MSEPLTVKVDLDWFRPSIDLALSLVPPRELVASDSLQGVDVFGKRPPSVPLDDIKGNISTGDTMKVFCSMANQAIELLNSSDDPEEVWGQFRRGGEIVITPKMDKLTFEVRFPFSYGGMGFSNRFAAHGSFSVTSYAGER